MKIKERDLIHFYQGDINEEKRFFIEEELLTSQPVLMEFLALKRAREVAFTPIGTPDRLTRAKIFSSFENFRPQAQLTKRQRLAASAAVLLLLAGLYIFEDVSLDKSWPSSTNDSLMSVDTANDFSTPTLL